MRRRDSTWPGGGDDDEEEEEDDDDDEQSLLRSRHCVKCLAWVTSLNLENSPKRMEYYHHFKDFFKFVFI